jgi:putative phosphonate metabolism protein
MRVALYYAPPIDDPLHQAASTWLGRDAETNAPKRQPDLPDIAAITEDARGYGFHATLKAPFRLAEGVHWNAFVAAVEQLAAGIRPFALPPLAVQDLHGFLALRETTQSHALQALADLCVAGVDHLRAPLSEAELARRRKGGQLPPAQEALLQRWGYTYVFGEFFFHMTLTRRLTAAEKDIYLPAATTHFDPILKQPRQVTDIALFTQAAPGAPFTIAQRIPLRG